VFPKVAQATKLILSLHQWLFVFISLRSGLGKTNTSILKHHVQLKAQHNQPKSISPFLWVNAYERMHMTIQ